MSANINVNLNHCELAPSVEQSAHGEFIWLVNGANTDRIMYLTSIFCLFHGEGYGSSFRPLIILITRNSGQIRLNS